MLLFEREIELPAVPGHEGLLAYLEESLPQRLGRDETAIRLAVTESSAKSYRCELGVAVDRGASRPEPLSSIFRLARRSGEASDAFNAVLIVPTGIGAEIGGHAGDATPAARLLAGVCDLLITNPNVVNGSDINEIPENGLYVEGSVLSRFLLGSVGLRQVRSNRVLVIVDSHSDRAFVEAVVNSVSAARSSYGLRCAGVVELDPPMRLEAHYAPSGRATGRASGLDALWRALDIYRERYDAVALSSVISVPKHYHMDYFTSDGEVVNPWGGVEALLTHSASTAYDVQSAHSPMLESREVSNLDPGIVDPRMAAEIVSVAFFQSVLKGLHRSPRIVTDREDMREPGVLTAANVSCVVLPEGCLGLPTLAALEQGIPVIAVRENRNLMRNDLEALPWAPEQLYVVENYWEAAGVMAALKSGIAPESVRRPLEGTRVETVTVEAGSDGESGGAALREGTTADGDGREVLQGRPAGDTGL